MADTRADHQEGELTSSLGAAIGVVMIAAARFAWLYSHAEVDTPCPALALLLFELPLIFCLLPLMTGERPDRSIKSGGMVFGTALSFCLVASPLWFDAQFTAWGRRTGDPAACTSCYWRTRLTVTRRLPGAPSLRSLQGWEQRTPRA